MKGENSNSFHYIFIFLFLVKLVNRIYYGVVSTFMLWNLDRSFQFAKIQCRLWKFCICSGLLLIENFLSNIAPSSSIKVPGFKDLTISFFSYFFIRKAILEHALIFIFLLTRYSDCKEKTIDSLFIGAIVLNFFLLAFYILKGITFKPCQIEQNYFDELIFRKE